MFRPSSWLAVVVALAACGDGGGQPDGGAADASVVDAAASDAPVGSLPDASARDAAELDGSSMIDATGSIDGSAPIDAAGSADAEPSGPLDEHVHILIDNFCNTSAQPASFTVPAGQTLQLTYHNHSVDYDADVWLSYGGGYLGLATGGTWADQFTFCTSPNPYTAYADLSIAGGGGTACPGFRLYIYCQ